MFLDFPSDINKAFITDTHIYGLPRPAPKPSQPNRPQWWITGLSPEALRGLMILNNEVEGILWHLQPQELGRVSQAQGDFKAGREREMELLQKMDLILERLEDDFALKLEAIRTVRSEIYR